MGLVVEGGFIYRIMDWAVTSETSDFQLLASI